MVSHGLIHGRKPFNGVVRQKRHRRRPGLPEKVVKGEMAAPADDKGPLDDVLEFPDVAGPVVGSELANRRFGEPGRWFHVQLPGLAGNKASGQLRDILFPGPQWRHPDGKDVEAEPEVLTKPFLFDHGKQVPVGGHNHAHIHGDGPAAPHPVELQGLENPQELHLGGRGKLPDLI